MGIGARIQQHKSATRNTEVSPRFVSFTALSARRGAVLFNISAGTLVQYNAWLDNATAAFERHGRVIRVPQLFGMVMGFTKAHPLAEYVKNALLGSQGVGVNYGQGGAAL